LAEIAAVAEQFVPVGVAGDALVVFEGGDQVVEGLARQIVARIRVSGAGRRRRDGLAIAAYMACRSPRHQARRRRLSSGVADFVAEVVGPAAEGVDVVEILVEVFRQQEADDVEVLVVVGGEPAGVRGPGRWPGPVMASGRRGTGRGCRFTVRG
jgi:hypothetical protein